MQFTPYLLPHLVSTAILGGLAVYAWRRRKVPGASALAAAMLLAALWALDYSLDVASVTLDIKLLWVSSRFIFISLSPLAWLAVTLQFTEYPDWLTWQRLVLLLLVPTATSILAWTQGTLTVFRYDYHLVSSGPLMILTWTNGPWYWVHVIYSYAIYTMCLILLLSELSRTHSLYRSQIWMVISSIVLPSIADILFQFGITPVPGYNLETIIFIISGGLISLALFRYRMLDIVPVARSAVMEHINDPTLVLDEQNRLVDFNPAAREILSAARKSVASDASSQVIGMPASQVLDAIPELVQCLQTREKNHSEIKVKIDGKQRYYDVQLSTLEDKKGQDDGRLAILREITDYKQMEEKLRESEQYYRQLIDTSPDGIALIDLDSRITFVSPRTYDIFAAPSDAPIIGESLLRWVDPEYHNIAIEDIKKLIAGLKKPDTPGIYKFLKYDRTPFWAEIKSTLLLDAQGQIKGFMSIIRDVTERKQMEQALQASENLYHSVINASPDGVAITDLQGDIRMASPAILRLFGYEKLEEVEGKNIGLFVASEDKGHASEVFKGKLEGNHTGVSEYRVIRKDGTIFYNEANVELIRGEDGQPTGVVFIVRDITSRKQVEEAEHEQHILAEALRDTAAALNSTLNYDEVLDRILINLEKVVPHDLSCILLVDDNGYTYAARSRGYIERGLEAVLGVHLSVTDTYSLHYMAETGEPYIVADVREDKNWIIVGDQEWLRAYLGAPIQVKGKVVGFLNLGKTVPGSFTQTHAERLQVFADQCAIAIENAHLYSEAQRRLKEQSILNEITRSISSSLEINQLLELVYQQVNRFIDARFFLISSYESETDEWQMVYSKKDDIILENSRYPTSKGLTGYVTQTRKPLFLRNIEAVNTFIKETGRTSLDSTPQSIMIVPMVVSDRIVGAIGVQNDEKENAYGPEDFALFTSIGAQIAAAFENARLFARMEQLAIVDTLTGLYNRRHFFVLAENEMERAHRYLKQLAVLMLDIDHFKKVNDTYGHSTGDVVLHAIAQLCAHTLRKIDIIGRYGGEEFAFILPETGVEEALAVAGRLRRAIDTTGFETKEGTVHVTASLGAAALSGKEDTLAVLLERADKALYAAKQAGRNQAKIFTKE